MYHFCTYFDSNYFLYGCTLLSSLKKCCRQDFRLYAAALDDRAFKLLSELDDERVVPIALADIEKFDPEYAACRNNRSKVEYYFTLSPVLPLFLMENFPEIDILCYLDSDLYFFDDPEVIFRELGDADVLIVPHRFGEKLKWKEIAGKYNVSFQLYRRSQDCFKLLQWWREKCIEWCYDVFEENRFADQKYLDYFHTIIPNVAVSSYPGAALAPWNWMESNWQADEKNGGFTVDGTQVVFYHFQGFRFLFRHVMLHNLSSYGAGMPRKLFEFLYGTYAREMTAVKNDLEKVFPQERFSLRIKAQRLGFSFFRMILSGIYHNNIGFVGK